MLELWKTYLTKKSNRINLVATFSLLLPVLIILPNFLSFIEQRPGISFNDPVLKLFNPVDLTWFTFILIYAALILALIHLRAYPRQLLLAFKVYAITVIFRIVGMYLLPLEPPAAMILLNDPFVQFFGSGEVLTKDLFFSGHTSIMFIFYLTAQTKLFKYFFLIATILVAIFVILQHVHYSIDVFAAPFFAFAAFKISLLIDAKFGW